MENMKTEFVSFFQLRNQDPTFFDNFDPTPQLDALRW